MLIAEYLTLSGVSMRLLGHLITTSTTLYTFIKYYWDPIAFEIHKPMPLEGLLFGMALFYTLLDLLSVPQDIFYLGVSLDYFQYDYAVLSDLLALNSIVLILTQVILILVVFDMTLGINSYYVSLEYNLLNFFQMSFEYSLFLIPLYVQELVSLSALYLN